MLGLIAGIASGSAMILYTVIKEANPPQYGGTATGAINLLNFTFTAIMGEIFIKIMQASFAGEANSPGTLSSYLSTTFIRCCPGGTASLRTERNGAGNSALQENVGDRVNSGTGKYERLLERCPKLDPVPTAVAHPCEETALAGAIEAAQKRLIAPILVGPTPKIKAEAKSLGVDLNEIQIVDTPHSQASAAKAVELVRQGCAELLMKGSLHTDELLAAVVARETGLRTGLWCAKTNGACSISHSDA